MAITKLTKHNSHQVSIHLCKPGRVHYAALRCADCDTHIQWLSKEDFFAVAGDGDLCSYMPSSSLGKEAKARTNQ